MYIFIFIHDYIICIFFSSLICGGKVYFLIFVFFFFGGMMNQLQLMGIVPKS